MTPAPSRSDLVRPRASAAAQTAAFAAGTRSPEDGLNEALAAIAERGAALNAFCLLAEADALRAQARASAARWRAGRPRGPLDGLTVAVKDTIRVRGWPMRSGSLTSGAEPVGFDAPAVARLREAGAILIGKTTTSEFGWKTVTDSPIAGITRNPWDPALTPGGSSGGAAAAIAAGQVALALGTDAAGSLRIPAAFCGVVGFKATRGRVPAFPPSAVWTLGHIGPITRCVDDAALMLEVIAAEDVRDWNALPPVPPGHFHPLPPLDSLAGLRVAVSADLGHARVDPEVARVFAAAVARLEALGARITELPAPLSDARAPFRTYLAAGYRHALGKLPAAEKARLDPGLAEVLAGAEGLGLDDFLAAYDFQIALTREARLLHRDHDLLLTPTAAVPPFAAGIEAPEGYAAWRDWAAFTYPFNLTGQPALSMFCGTTAAGLPVGLQIVGPHYGDRLVLQVARLLEDRAFPPPCLGPGLTEPGQDTTGQERRCQEHG